MSTSEESKGKNDNRIIIWNVRSALHNCYIYLMDLIADQKPTMLIILEAPKIDSCLNNVISKLGFEGFKLDEGVQRRGNIWYLWRKPIIQIDFISTRP